MKRLLTMLLAISLLSSAVPSFAEDNASRVFTLLWSEDERQIQTLWEYLDPAAQKQITPAVLMSLKGQLTQAYGPWLENGETTIQNQNGVTLCLMPVTFERMSLQMQLVYGNEKILGLAFTPLVSAAPPAPATNSATVEEVEITIGEGTKYPLPGILTLPQEGSQLPLVVMVHGSGPNDRDESIGATRMFRDLAAALAEKGIASIRYDKRTLVHGASFTVEEMRRFSVKEESIEDALLAAQMTKNFERIDPERIFVIGHSLGAMIAPRIVKDGEGLFKGMVLLSGSPNTLLKIMIDQNQAVVNGLEGEIKTQQQRMLDQLVAEAEANLALSEAEVQNCSIFGQPGYYFWEMAQFDTAELIRQQKVPALIINGGRDFQVVDDNGVKAWEQALKDCEHIELIYEPNLNHLLMEYTGDPALMGTVKEYDTPAMLDTGVGEKIADWILAQQ
ncbi:MAG: alpha/beta fold hydrolase [Clostridia bacterium]|nr:alpha/beta fold hydrolase [Clostridia bacterium]